MNVEEKAVFECLEDETNIFAGAYEELDDDFLTALNEGAPAMEQVKNIHKLPPKPAAESDQIDSSQQNYPTS